MRVPVCILYKSNKYSLCPFLSSILSEIYCKYIGDHRLKTLRLRSVPNIRYRITLDNQPSKWHTFERIGDYLPSILNMQPHHLATHLLKTKTQTNQYKNTSTCTC